MFTRLHRPLAALLGAGALVAGALAGAGAAAPSFADAPPAGCTPTASVSVGVVTLTFGPTGGNCLWTVPNGVTNLTMTANGAQGGAGAGGGAAGKLGDQATATFDVTSGEPFILQVGAKGGDGGFGGGAGGALTGGAGAQCGDALGGGGGGGGASFVWQGSDGNLANDTIYLGGGGGGGSKTGFGSVDGSGGGGGAYSTSTADHTANGPDASAGVCATDGPSGLSFWNNSTGTLGATNGSIQSGDGVVIVSFDQLATTTTLVSNTNPIAYGQALSLTATVSPAPSEGRVEFRWSNDGGSSSSDITDCSAVTPDSTTGVATCNVVVPELHAGGANQVQAFYDDNGTDLAYADSTSNVVNQSVIKADVNVSLTSSANPAVYGQPITFTATVDSQQSIDPTADPISANAGTVDFIVDPIAANTLICDDVSLVAGTGVNAGKDVATCTLTGTQAAAALAKGPHYILATYSGSDDYNTANGNLDNQAITAANTSVSLSSSPNPSVYGQPFTITATVTADAPSTINPTIGYVEFTIDGEGVDCQFDDADVTVTSASNVTTATCTIAYYDDLEDLHVGDHTVRAQFFPVGDSNYNVSPAASLTQVINPAATITTATAVYYDWAPAPTVAITATVTINPPSILSFQPTIGLYDVDRGTVSFFNGSTLLCTVPLDEWGQALCESAIDPATVAPHSLTAIYNYGGSDADFLSSSATTDAVAHLAQPTIVTITTVFPNAGASWLVQGGGFSGASSVTVCGVAVPFTVINDNTMLIGVPNVNAPQQCTVTITAAGGVGSSGGTVTVVPKPQPGAPVVVFPTGPSTPTTPACGETADLTLSNLWTLIAWPGEDTPVAEALSGGSDNCGSDVTAKVSVIWGFDAATQTYYAYFPDATDIPGANDLDTLKRGLGYWVALNDPSASVTWTVVVG